jgi:hypothetical protein
MARIWKEPWDNLKHSNRMAEFGFFNPRWADAPSLFPREIYLVRVCSFTFEFCNLTQIKECLAYFTLKIHPSSRTKIGTLEHWEAQRWFERLPLFLSEEPKRKKVVAALTQALDKFSPESKKKALSTKVQLDAKKRK